MNIESSGFLWQGRRAAAQRAWPDVAMRMTAKTKEEKTDDDTRQNGVRRL